MAHQVERVRKGDHATVCCERGVASARCSLPTSVLISVQMLSIRPPPLQLLHLLEALLPPAVVVHLALETAYSSGLTLSALPHLCSAAQS